jgi:hypothetical protein
MPGERIGNSNQFLSISGVVSAPAYSWASDNNTGIYRIGANNIGVAADGAKVLDIATTGLTVTGTGSFTSTATASALIPSGSGVPANGVYLPAANTVGISTNTTERARIDSSGNLLVGTASTSGAATNAAILAGGIFRTVTGTTSIVQSTPTTIFAHQGASWLVTAYSEATGYAVTGVITAVTGGPQATNLTSLPPGPNAGTLSISGADVQLTFGGLSTANATWNAIRIG